MGSSHNHAPAPEAAFAAAFRDAADPTGVVRFDAFMALALYDPTLGYYRRNQSRVGRSADTDFYTSTSSGPLFGELIAAAAAELLGPTEAATHTFVELGAEGGRGVLPASGTPFVRHRTVAVGEPFALTGPCVVFSNELFDAQPFRRFRLGPAGWEEGHVAINEDGTLTEIHRPVDQLPFALPDDVALPAGYRIDWSEAAIALAREIASAPWHGLFIAIDYGKSWWELATQTPAGTGRAYRRHQQSNALLAQPGHQDITSHVCWDDLSTALTDGGFTVAPVCSQESFLVKNAGGFLAKVLAEEGGNFSARKQSIMQLLHPGNLGQKFQVLHARRQTAENSP